MKKFGISRILLIFVIVATLLIGSSSISFAATSYKSINYKGSGSVEITLAKETTYNNLKVSIKDNTGKTYRTKITSKSTSKLRFTIYNYKTGRVYRIAVSGYKNGAISASMEIISRKAAISTAKRSAKKFGASKFNDVVAESTTYRGTAVWKVTFESNGANYAYHISQQTGKVLRSEKK